MKSIISSIFILFFTHCIKAQNVSTLVQGPSTFTDGLALDKFGNIYASDYFGNSVTKITPNGQTSIFVSGLVNPNGLIFDSLGNLLIPQVARNIISTVDTAGNIDTLLESSLPAALYFDHSSDLIVSSYFNNTILKYDTSGNSINFWTQGSLNGPVGLLFDSLGNFYVGNFNNGTIYKRDINDSIMLLADLPGTLGFMTMSENYIYATGLSSNRIYKVPMDGSQPANIFAGSSVGSIDGHVSIAKFNSPNGIVATPTGDTLYISEANTRQLRMITGLLNPTTVYLENQSQSQLNIAFPNPSNGKLNFEFWIENTENIQLKLLGMDGVSKYTYDAGIKNVGKNTISIDLSTADFTRLNSGIYWYSIKGKTTLIEGKIVVE